MTREDILRALREEFRENTRTRLVEMSGLIETLSSDPDADQLHSLERHFHGLAGLGGTYGYASVTAISREGEDACAHGASSPEAVDFARLADILAIISAAIEEVPDSE